jgi:hypothetical protein
MQMFAFGTSRPLRTPTPRSVCSANSRAPSLPSEVVPRETAPGFIGSLFALCGFGPAVIVIPMTWRSAAKVTQDQLHCGSRRQRNNAQPGRAAPCGC